MKKIVLYTIIGFVSFVFLSILILIQKPAPEQITYGVSFNTPYARELGLDWRETYDSIIDDLGVRHLRLAAHWPMVEPIANVYNFEELDYQIKKAEKVKATVIFAVGRRLPRWPECHIPDWVKKLSVEEQQYVQLRYMEEVVERYKSSSAIIMWQVENEPFLELFAFEHCGELDRDFFDEEVSLVKMLDPTRPILITDSGNLGMWNQAYSRGDVFGTSVYVHFWNPELGQFRTILPPSVYRLKDNLMKLIYGKKPSILIELSAEPWLLEPIVDVPIEVQFSRMDIQKFDDIITYAEKTRFDIQYLWGAEWWYWLYLQGRPEMWNYGRDLYF